MGSPRVESRLSIEDGALVWRLAGVRGRSDQTTSGGKKTARKVGRARAAHWAQASRLRKQDREFWKTLLVVATSRNEAPIEEIWECPRPAHIVVKVWGHPLPDACNVVGYHKYAIDALVALGFIADDGPRFAPRATGESLAERPEWLPDGVGCELRLERAA